MLKTVKLFYSEHTIYHLELEIQIILQTIINVVKEEEKVF